MLHTPYTYVGMLHVHVHMYVSVDNRLVVMGRDV